MFGSKSFSTFWLAGAGGVVAAERIIAAARYDSAPIRRMVRKARGEGRLIDLTYGQAIRWVLFLDDDHVVLASKRLPVISDEGE